MWHKRSPERDITKVTKHQYLMAEHLRIMPRITQAATNGLERLWWAVVSLCAKSINDGHEKTYVDQPKINRRPTEDGWHKDLAQMLRLV